MGDPKFPKKRYDTPLHPWKADRITSERELMKKYGLKNHREIWKAKTFLGRYRQHARKLLAQAGSENEHNKREAGQLVMHLNRMGILAPGSGLDDILALDTEMVLSRRLQTLVYLKGLTSTAKQARQLIAHGHIAIHGKKVTIPSYMVTKEDENEISYTSNSPLNELSHPARPKADAFKRPTPSEERARAAPDERRGTRRPEPKKEERKAEPKKEERKAEPKKEDMPAQQEKPAENISSEGGN